MAEHVTGLIAAAFVLRVRRDDIGAALTTTDHIPGLRREFVDWVKNQIHALEGPIEMLALWLPSR